MFFDGFLVHKKLFSHSTKKKKQTKQLERRLCFFKLSKRAHITKKQDIKKSKYIHTKQLKKATTEGKELKKERVF